MKKIYFILLLSAITTVCMPQNIGEAFYIYRNDGQFNAFFRDEVLSIEYSNYDLDSVFHDDFVVQDVYTQDSIYRIPLAVIDSVSFVTPPTVYKNDVTRIEYSLLDYVIGADGLTLKLKTETPTMLLPVRGDKLILLQECEVLPNGFSGIVINVQQSGTSIDVVCEQAYLEDLFDSFCSVSTIFGCNPDSLNVVRSRIASRQRRVTYNPDDVVFSLGPYKASCSGEISQGIVPGGDLALSGGTSFSVETEPTFLIHTFLILGEGHGTYFSCSITGNLRVSSKGSLYGGLSFNHDFDKLVKYFPIPQTANLVNFYINPGVFVRANATITSKLSITDNYTFGMAFDYSSKGQNSVKPYLKIPHTGSSVDMEGCLDGSLAGGGYIETGFSLLCREISRVCIRGELGYQFNGNFVLRNSDIDNASEETSLYERLKASSVSMGPFVNAGVYASIGGLEGGVKWELSDTHLKRDLVPMFSNTKLTHTHGSMTSAGAYTELRGNCLFPLEVGYKLFDENRNEVCDFDADSRYSSKASKMEHTFTGLEKGMKYKVYPKVKLFGHDILANPEAELNVTMPEIIDFRVTNSSYSKGAYSNGGRLYDYKFDAATTMNIESLEGIEDWGYVYEDPYGNISRISLMQYGNSYTDTRYAYYRNEPQSTACLYAYVRYAEDTEYYDGEPHEYELKFSPSHLTCPDDHHPHAIDLGLPSGTKWCCCNVGASTPEGYGGYYAWGETSEKSHYSSENYAYYNSETGYTNIGSDIAGTSYDVAYVRMGAPWRMPSIAQQKELVNNCSKQWTQQNDVNGILVTGPNGGQIFLPAAGARWDGGIIGVSGHSYWSSSLNSYFDYNADCLFFLYGYLDWVNNDRCFGQPVRAVCP